MRRLLLKGKIRLFCRSVLRFLDRSACRAMGCFFDCFRARDDQSSSNLVSHSSRVKSRGGAASQNRLSDLFLSEEKAASPCPDKEGFSLDSIHIDKGLKDEAKFLKACGTIPATPIEIRKASRKLETPQHDKDSRSSKFHSWLQNNSMMKFQLDEKIEELPTPFKAFEELRRQSVSSEQTPSSCMTNVQNSERICSGCTDADEEEQGSISSVLRDDMDRTGEGVLTPSLGFSVGNAQGRTKSVRFECDFGKPSPVSSSQKSSSRKPEIVGTVTSPNPTPLKLSDEMQTPGTVFAANFESAGRGNARIQSQFVYSVPNLIENASVSNVAKESDEVLQLVKMQAPNEQIEGKTPRSDIHGNKGEESTDGKVSKVEASFSPWLKQSDEDNENMGAISARAPRYAITPGDRPIIGMVAAHWNEEELSQISPKWWDGNGIPNSTHKYKEDQKVSWHATPFEERLEKALSEESVISQRKVCNGEPVIMEEGEGDTAISQLQHSAQSKSVVSF